MAPSLTELKKLPGKPVAHNHGLLSMDYGLLWAIVVHDFELLGFPGRLLTHHCLAYLYRLWTVTRSAVAGCGLQWVGRFPMSDVPWIFENLHQRNEAESYGNHMDREAFPKARVLFWKHL